MEFTIDTIILATSNKSKIVEFSALLAGISCFPHKVLGLTDFPDIGEIEERGVTFAENAWIKAETVFRATGLVAVADDSGLEVDALRGAPGVYSARYAGISGPGAADANNAKLLGALSGLPLARRTARFRCVIVALGSYGAVLSVEGKWDGYVIDAPRGLSGFGYDPLFFDPEIGLTAAELHVDVKNERSHRGQAFRRLLFGWPKFIAKATIAI